MIHGILHFAVPLLVALAFYRPKWAGVAATLLATMIVDVDHLLADPIYDPSRCSIGFHPLHTSPAITLYVAMIAAPLASRVWPTARDPKPALRALHLIGLGLMIHMVLDLGDCFL